MKHTPRHRALSARVWACLLPCSLTFFVALVGQPATAETWTDSLGTHKVEADFVRLLGQDVFLKKQNGVTIKVPLSKLDAKSQELARKLAAGASDSPDVAWSNAAEGVMSGNLRAVWDAFPTSYQSDVNALVHTFASNMDTGLWTAGTGILKNVAKLAKDKKKFILEHPAVAANKDNLAKNWDKITALLEAIVASELTDLSKLKKVDVGDFLDGSGKKIIDQVIALAKEAQEAGAVPDAFAGGLPVAEMSALGKIKFTKLSVDGDKAKVRVEAEGKPAEEVEAVRVEGKWVPKDMADGWAAGIAMAKQKLTEMGPALAKSKQGIMVPMTGVNMALQQLLAAKTQAEFNKLLDQYKGLLGGIGGAGPGVGPPSGPPSANPFDAPVPKKAS